MPTKIEWTSETLNPVTGCDRVSEGCDSCYIERTIPFRAAGRRFDERGHIDLEFHPERLQKLLRRRKPTFWFINSLSDLFHPDIPDDFIENVLCTMNAAPQHTYQILTKRPQRMAKLLSRVSWDCNGDLSLGRFTAEELGLAPSRWYDVAARMPQTWWGTSIELDKYTWRANHLRATPSAVRWLSCEPLLGPLPSLDLTGIDWVVVGGESGPGAREMDLDWAREIRDRCEADGVAFFMKQLGAVVAREGGMSDQAGHTIGEFPEDLRIREYPVSATVASE